MVERFNALARLRTFVFEAWFSARTAADRSWEIDETGWEFKYRYLPTLAAGAKRVALPLSLFRWSRPDLLVSLYGEPSFLIGWQLARMRNVRTAFWAEVTFDTWIKRRSWKELAKRTVFSRVDGVITPGDDGRRFARSYGTADERIHNARHRIDVQYFARKANEAVSGRNAYRARLGLAGVTFLYVGRLWRGKGLDHLLDAFGVLQRRLKGEASLLLVGDGPEEAHLRARCDNEGLQNVVFAGFKQKQELPRYYAAGDVFVFPTLGDPYGLVVDEAMASGLPVISTSCAGEIRQRVEERISGYIVPAGNSAALLTAMETLAVDQSLRERMGQASARSMDGQSPELWAHDFEEAVEKILSMPRASAKVGLLELASRQGLDTLVE
jgi:glycosyltransferase involved in cell wall biosynthesis